eukprot:3633790-Pyramimonas_sp.AAC.1
MPGSGARTFGKREGARGARVTAQTRQPADILEALRHVSRRCFQLPDVRAMRALRGQTPQSPGGIREIHLVGVEFDARAFIGDQ